LPIENGPILIVDDEPINLATLRHILEPQYNLVFARSGASALDAVAKHRPSLILLDIQMPDIDGYTVCRLLKANPESEEIPVIFVTALSDVGNEETGFSAGCVDYLTKPLSTGVVQARVRAHLSLVCASQLEKSQKDAIFMLGEAAHFNDNDTGTHIWRMADYARALAQSVGWTLDGCNLIELAAPMHDTGKIGIPDSILRKASELDKDEWAIMQTHTRIGFEILSKSNAPVFKLAAEIALHHHEKWDGSGYPYGMKGQKIPESARIVAIADVFDALCRKRSYKESWSLDKILGHLSDSAGRHFDPALINKFTAILPQIIEIKEKWEEVEIIL
jgi:putative two-component system response regulator